MQIRAGADRIVAHGGAWVLGELADRSGLTRGLSEALAPLKQRRRGHDRGHVLTQLAVADADGATTVSDLAVLRHPPDLFGRVAAASTVWRRLTLLTAEALIRIAAARAAFSPVGASRFRDTPIPHPLLATSRRATGAGLATRAPTREEPLARDILAP